MKQVAVKTLQSRKEGQYQQRSTGYEERVPRRFLSEVSVWCGLNHKNILEFLGLAESSKHGLPLSMVSPWIVNGNVTEYIKLNPSTERLPLILGVAEGVQFLHSNGIVHGDIKGPNILMSDNFEPLLCDFGMAKFCETYDYQNVSTTLRYAGSTRYMAIELLWEGATKTSNGSDMWAFGMTCVEILTAQMPYPDCLDGPVIIKIHEEIFPGRPSECPDPLWSFMQRCWRKVVKDRPTSQDAVGMMSELLKAKHPPIRTYNVIDHPLA
ncbi:kinase-like protein [Schizopora paradoxa]|uniref:Kinase-like protein n=1 Tax=Schizopora paradoxa TaxID=27342 RepID=A0A0H2S1Q7_9AGAM|nr:kinase-like protein [Schizopora paradoxa]